MSFIYIRYHSSYLNYCKLGKTDNIITRDNNYATGEHIRGYYELVIDILNYENTLVEKILQRYFKNYNVVHNAGKEFFDKKIINEIIPFLNKTNIKFNILSKDDINNLIRNEQLDKAKNILNKFLKKDFRNKLQDEYVNDIIFELNNFNKAFIKAPTGFGKTHIYYKLIQKMQFNKILFLTPRILLNSQLLEDKYSFYIKDCNYKFIDVNSDSSNKFIMTCCYQSTNKLLEYTKNNNIKFDIIIFDEAHYNINEQLLNSDICKYKLFGSATPTDIIESNSLLYGKIIEKVKIYELINKKILCNIETIIKKLVDNKKKYHNLKNLIIDSMIKYNKKKGIIYVNNCSNAEQLYKLMKSQDTLDVYIYVSKNIELEDNNDKDIKAFENNKKPCIIICVGKIGYGYDNDLIDFICLGDSRQSDIDIRQIIGRGLRWNKSNYSNKLLHLLIPLYKDQFGNYKNEHLKKYLDYIIGECGQDIIIKKDGSSSINSMSNNNKNDYEGDDIPIEILREYCTTGYNKFTDFMRFLRKNNIYDEITYNEMKEKQNWMIDLGLIRDKYPKFCFRDIHPYSRNYYWTKTDGLIKYKIAYQELINKIGKNKITELIYESLIKKINDIDNKIPLTDFDLYYPIQV